MYFLKNLKFLAIRNVLLPLNLKPETQVHIVINSKVEHLRCAPLYYMQKVY